MRIARAALRWLCIAALAGGLSSADAQPKEGTADAAKPLRIDRVVAVVNRQPILESDIEDEMQLSVLDPSTNSKEQTTQKAALERLISRALIQQQIQQEDLEATEPKSEEVAARIEEIRKEVPTCVRADCKSDAGWNAFLAHHELTPAQVEIYMRHRMEILNFIELRFQQGIRITPEEIETYYAGTLLPQYPAGEKPPPLQQVSSRIEEILLQQRVNVLFDNWLSNLRKQGQVEVLDPALESADAASETGAPKE
ncbi:MAG TPA: SurA N-terminal domain-containing protein [Terracidiphilus sp.]|nr:SurA N-terminal domain-containing protein [Terracidiphilus sp.]